MAPGLSANGSLLAAALRTGDEDEPHEHMVLIGDVNANRKLVIIKGLGRNTIGGKALTGTGSWHQHETRPAASPSPEAAAGGSQIHFTPALAFARITTPSRMPMVTTVAK